MLAEFDEFFRLMLGLDGGGERIVLGIVSEIADARKSSSSSSAMSSGMHSSMRFAGSASGMTGTSSERRNRLSASGDMVRARMPSEEEDVTLHRCSSSSDGLSTLPGEDKLPLRPNNFRGDHQLEVGEIDRSERLCLSVGALLLLLLMLEVGSR